MKTLCPIASLQPVVITYAAAGSAGSLEKCIPKEKPGEWGATNETAVAHETPLEADVRNVRRESERSHDRRNAWRTKVRRQGATNIHGAE